MDIIVWQNRLKHRKQKKNVHCKSIVHAQPLFIFCYNTDKNGKGKFKAILKNLTHILCVHHCNWSSSYNKFENGMKIDDINTTKRTF